MPGRLLHSPSEKASTFDVLFVDEHRSCESWPLSEDREPLTRPLSVKHEVKASFQPRKSLYRPFFEAQGPREMLVTISLKASGWMPAVAPQGSMGEVGKGLQGLSTQRPLLHPPSPLILWFWGCAWPTQLCIHLSHMGLMV